MTVMTHEQAALLALVNEKKDDRAVWLPADFERAMQAVAAIDATDSLHDLEGDSKTRREAYAKEIVECDRMMRKLRRVCKRAWLAMGWCSKNGVTPP